MVRELTKSGKVFNSRCTFSFLRTAPSRLLRRKQKPVPRYYSVRVMLLLQRKPHGRHRQRLLALSALALRLLRQARSNATTGSPQRFSCSVSVSIAPTGLKRTPLRGDAIFIPTLHPRRASPASPVGRGRGPAAAAVAFASLPCVPVPLALLAPPPLRSLTLVAAGIPPRVAGRSPPRLNPRLRFGHPARPPKGQLRCSFLYTSAGFGALFVVALSFKPSTAVGRFFLNL